MQFEPAFLDRVANAGAEFRAGALAAVLRQERRVDLLDVDAAVLHWLYAGGELNKLCSPRLPGRPRGVRRSLSRKA